MGWDGQALETLVLPAAGTFAWLWFWFSQQFCTVLLVLFSSLYPLQFPHHALPCVVIITVSIHTHTLLAVPTHTRFYPLPFAFSPPSPPPTPPHPLLALCLRFTTPFTAALPLPAAPNLPRLPSPTVFTGTLHYLTTTYTLPPFLVLRTTFFLFTTIRHAGILHIVPTPWRATAAFTAAAGKTRVCRTIPLRGFAFALRTRTLPRTYQPSTRTCHIPAVVVPPLRW